ncbi:histone-lysine N-methyltransferase SETMAR-like [Macrosteles quadrilineatus]|uniref:histone-lysine N-methyltransferase SETMAR-like n=1 Tax=Macrosteles quadrilineatus TaxID=74068 RepID=UPI0023E2DBD6|nr:histone-lysine N-methyltransferase SETMAR-like [Macrosteles quadrilineatus]
MVSHWRQSFIDGRKSLHDEQRNGRPSTSRASTVVEDVRKVIDTDRRLTWDEIITQLPPNVEISRASLHRIILNDLSLSKVCARWVPRLLSERHKEQRVDAALQFQQFFDDEGDGLFNRIVTGDETWVHICTPESKRQSMVWKRKDEPTPKKAKVVESAGKVMATVFWDSKGALLIDYLPRGGNKHS